ncbi:MAG: hypothetical protein WCI48_16460, partial [Bacteroidota bacterium]
RCTSGLLVSAATYCQAVSIRFIYVKELKPTILSGNTYPTYRMEGKRHCRNPSNDQALTPSISID